VGGGTQKCNLHSRGSRCGGRSGRGSRGGGRSGEYAAAAGAAAAAAAAKSAAAAAAANANADHSSCYTDEAGRICQDAIYAAGVRWAVDGAGGHTARC
jgi:hypothetical protein